MQNSSTDSSIEPTTSAENETMKGLESLEGKTFYELVRERELEIIETAIYNTKNITKAGEALGLHRTTVSMIMKRLGIYEQYYAKTGKRFINYNVKSAAKKEKSTKKTSSEE